MKFYILFAVILIIPYSGALAQNSEGKSSIFLSDQGSRKCVNCGNKVYNSGSGASSASPFSIKRMIQSNQTARQMKSADIIRRAERFNQTGSMKEIYDFYNRGSSDNERKLYELSLETQQREAQKIAEMSAERGKRAELIRARSRQNTEALRRSEAAHTRRAEQLRQERLSSYTNTTGANRQSASGGRDAAQGQSQQKLIYRGKTGSQERRKKTGTRVFLSPR